MRYARQLDERGLSDAVAPDAVVYRVANPVKRTFRERAGNAYPGRVWSGGTSSSGTSTATRSPTASWPCRAC